jgi:hypothetical protein
MNPIIRPDGKNSATPTCLDQPELDNQLILETPGTSEWVLSRFKEGSVTNACIARDLTGNDLFFFADLLNNADAEACRALIFARASALGVTCNET